MLPEKRLCRSSSLDMFSSSAPERGFASRLGGGHGCKRIDGFRDSSAVFDACADPLHCWHHVEQQYGRAGFDWRLSKVSGAPMRWRTIGSVDFEIARKQKRLSAATRSGDVWILG